MPGVFSLNPISAVNGALWTIKIEIGFHILLLEIALLLRKVGWIIIPAVYLGSLVYVSALEAIISESGEAVWKVLAKQLPGQLSFFISGVIVVILLTILF